MATILPNEISESTTSNAERKLFNLFKKVNEDWIVFHSLGLKDHVNKIFGEIDFLIITYEGFLCLEVKGGGITRENGSWYYVNRNGEKFYSHEGPFKQSLSAMYSLRKYISNHLGKSHPLVKTQFASGVAFPDIQFEEHGPEIISEIIFDQNYSIDPAGLEKFVTDSIGYWRNKLKKLHNIETRYLNDSMIQSAKKLLRSDFGIVPSLKSEMEDLNNEILELTNEQYKYLSMLDQNSRFIISGRAGSGKTLMAVERAKKLALKGNKVLLLFYNKLISNNIKNKFSKSELEFITVDNFHNFIFNIVQKFKNDKDVNYNSKFFSEKLPEEFLEYIEFSQKNNYYDYLIVDEGQDLIKDNYLLCLDSILKAGLDDGNWIFFHDPAQNLYNDEFKESLIVLNEYRPVAMHLSINCRNAKKIANCNNKLTEIDCGSEFRVDGGDVEFLSYQSNKDQQKKVKNIVKNLISENINLGDIVILSPNKYEKSFLKGENIFKSTEVVDLTKNMDKYPSDNILKFSTVHSFKGLESNIVILTDIDQINSDYSRIINYTAISRAKIKLYLLYDKELEVDRIIHRI